MQFRNFLLNLASSMLSEFDDEVPDWAPLGVAWDRAGGTPPSELRDMAFEIESLYDEDSIELMLLRDAKSSVVLDFGRSPGREPVWQVAVPVGWEASRAYSELASQLQDHLAESSEAWGKPLPGCPRHEGRHPLSPRDSEPRAAWWCPRDDVLVRELPAA